MPDKSKFEREIDEILEKSDDDKGSGGKRTFEPFSPTVPKTGPKRRPGTGMKLNSGQMIIGGLVLIAIAAFVPAVQVPLAAAGLALLVVGYVMWFRGGSRGSSGSAGSSGIGLFGRGRMPKVTRKSEPEVKYWRGRRIEDKPKRSDRPNRTRDKGKIIDFGSADDKDPDEK
jgi:hypothetical protein